MKVELPLLIDQLRAAGEPTRMRILSLLRSRDLAVGELVQVLGQSQPRLSHHLKALTTAGLVERLPEGSFVFYRAASHGAGRQFLESLFAQTDPEQGEFVRDFARLEEVSAARADAAESYFASVAETWDTVRGLHSPNDAIEAALLDMVGPGPFQRVLDFGTGTGRMLSLFADRARAAEGIDFSHQMLTVARANLERDGHDNARVRQGDVTATPFETSSADLVIVHQVLHFIDSPHRVLAEASRVLKPGGRLFIVDFAPHDLEFLRTEHGHHRLGVPHEGMKVWAEDAGLVVSDPLAIEPPASAEQGLTVNIWQVRKPAQAERGAA